VSVESHPGSGPEIENLLAEKRTFPPDPAFAAQANVTAAIYDEANADYVGFWERQAKDRLSWYTPFGQTLDWDLPFAKWFVGGELNVAYNCVDRHVERGLGDRVAYHWVGEPGDTRTLTYADLMRESSKAANALLELGAARVTGSRLHAHDPGCRSRCSPARASAPRTLGSAVSAEALSGRINDCGAKVLITADGGWRRGKKVGLKHHADEACVDAPSIEHVIVVDRFGDGAHMVPRRDHWWHDIVDRQSEVCPPVPVDSEHMLYLLYTSGTTAKPKGILHTTAGYLLGAAFTHWAVFDVKPDDVYWCAADIGWVTGHSYIVYGPLSLGVTGVIYEGSPDWPDKDRFWTIIEKYGVTCFYTAPTAIRTFMKWGTEFPARHDLSSLRLLGTVGEPINPEAWMWYYEHIGAKRCPVVDTWWQTETGAIMCTPLPGVTTLKPGSATKPFPGIDIDVLNAAGESVKVGGGFLAIKRPWPAMLRGIYGDPERYVTTYWSRWGKDVYFPGDGAKRDEDGYFWILGRVDDVLNVAGHRIGTMEVESALVDHPDVAEAAVVGRAHDLKGQALSAFVTLKEGRKAAPSIVDDLKQHVVKKIGAIARPDDIIITADLPKTRSGKIMRRLLRDIAEGKALGDTTTLADPSVVEKLKEKYADET
jgi:acetyl-CoA synthetase